MLRSFQLMACLAAAVLARPGAPSARAAETDELPVVAPVPSSPAPTLSKEQIGRLIERLGEESFAVRRQAQRELAAAGLQVQAALTAGLKHADPEVRRSCRRLLADVAELDYRRRLASFIADPQGRENHNLPGWERYRRIVGDDRPARELFIEMHREEPGLLAAVDAGDESAAEALQLRFLQVYRQLSSPIASERSQPSLGTVAALTFVNADQSLDLPEKLIDNPYWPQLILAAVFQKALADGPYQDSAKQLLGGWIARPTGSSLVSQKLRYAVRFEIPEGIEVGLRVIKQDSLLTPYNRVYGISAIGRLGGKPYAAALAELLDDRGECGRRIINNQAMSIEIRDVALAWLIHLTGQSHADYGQRSAKAQFDRIARSANSTVSSSSLGFSDPESREAALKKWAQWVKQNPLPKLPATDRPARPQAGGPDATKSSPTDGARRSLVKSVPDTTDGHRPSGGPDSGPSGALRDTDAGGLRQMPPTLRRLPESNRDQARNLADARRLIAQERYADAAGMLGGILRSPEDFVFAPDREIRLSGSVHAEAERLVASLPAVGRRAYESQFADEAAASLRAAVERDDRQSFSNIADRYFFTPAGAEATFRLGAIAFSRGDVERAAIYFERLSEAGTRAEPFGPSLWVRLAACRLLAGRPDAARDVLADLQRRAPHATIQVGEGLHRLPADGEDPLEWLQAVLGLREETWAGLAALSENRGWLLYRGDVARNAASKPGTPYLKATLLSPPAGDSFLSETIAELQKKKRSEYRLALSTLHPLLVGDTLVLRTPTHLRAIDAATGRLRWEAPCDDSLFHLLRHADDERKRQLKDFVTRGLERRLWADATFGTLSSDGRRVFCVEDLPFGPGVDYSRIAVTRDGKRRLDAGWLKRYCTLTAYDVETGKVAWEIGGSPDEAHGSRPVGFGEQAGAFFLGPPLPAAGRLYVVATARQRVRLLELDPVTGRTLSSTILSQPGSTITLSMNSVLPFLNLQGASRRIGLSPSAADGILVCPTSGSRYVALDLATLRVRWIYRAGERDFSGGRSVSYYWERRIIEETAKDASNDWTDATVTLADGRALLTPRGVGKLICLNLSDGRPLWSAPRHDGLYVAGVRDGRVLVVGSGGLRALWLADGSSAWAAPRLKLPDGAMPSGRGYLAENLYYLPLSTAQIAAIDLIDGKVASRSVSARGATPGNLIRGGGRVLSGDAGGVWRLELLADQAGAPFGRCPTLAALEQNPEDPAALTERAAVLLASGRPTDAARLLISPASPLFSGHDSTSDDAHRVGPAAYARQLLLASVADGLPGDFDSFGALLPRLEQTIQTPAERGSLIRVVAGALYDAGQPDQAFRRYLKLIDDERSSNELKYFSVGRRARAGRWLRARLEEIHSSLPERGRDAIDQETAGAIGDRSPEAIVDLFPRHPSATAARITLAEELAESKQWLRAERHLLHVMESGTQPERRAATARLAMLLRSAGRSADAASYYNVLAGQYAEAVCLDGKTGRELADALPADDPVRLWMRSGEAWPTGPPVVEHPNNRHSLSTSYSIPVAGSAGRDVLVSVNSSGQTLTIARSDGRPPRAVNLGRHSSPRRYFSSSMFTHAQAGIYGNLLVVWLVDRVAAVDLLSDKAEPLWVRETWDSSLQVAGMYVVPPQRLMTLQRSTSLPASVPGSLLVTDEAVCFQQDRTLVAVDSLTGEPLWIVEHLPMDSDLFGDEELLFVTPPQGNEARVFSLVDGKEVGRRSVPPMESRMTILGRRIVTSVEAAGRRRLAVIDPWLDRVIWQRDFSDRARVWPIDQMEAAVLDPSGRFVVVNLGTGRLTLETSIERQPQLRGFVVFASLESYVVVVNRPGAGNNVFTGQIVRGDFPAGGGAYAVDRATGRTIWSSAVANQQINVYQPRQLPVLTFLAQRREGGAASGRIVTRLLTIDKRTGRELIDATLRSYSNRLQTLADPLKRKIEIRTRSDTFRLDYSSTEEDAR